MRPHPQLDDHTIIEAVKQQVSCELSGEAVVLNLQNGVYYGLNPVGARIWQLLQDGRSVAEIRSVLLNEFKVDLARCNEDLQNLLQDLFSHDLIEIRNVDIAQIPSPSD